MASAAGQPDFVLRELIVTRVSVGYQLDVVLGGQHWTTIAGSLADCFDRLSVEVNRRIMTEPTTAWAIWLTRPDLPEEERR